MIFGELWLLYVVDWVGRGGACVSVDALVEKQLLLIL